MTELFALSGERITPGTARAHARHRSLYDEVHASSYARRVRERRLPCRPCFDRDGTLIGEDAGRPGATPMARMRFDEEGRPRYYVFRSVDGASPPRPPHV